MRKYYIIVCEGQSHNGHFHRHLTVHEALTDAKRLSRLFPNSIFYVLEALAIVQWPPLEAIVTLLGEGVK